MLVTLKLKTQVLDFPFQREYSSVFRYAYERTKEGLDQKQIRALAKEIWSNPQSNNEQGTNSWIVQCAIMDAQAQHAAHEAQIESGQRKTHSVVWGGAKNLKLRAEGKINKAEWRRLRLRPMCLQGEAAKKSNRLFDFSGLDKGIIIYKPNRHTKLEIPLQVVSKNQAKKLAYIANRIGQIPIQVQLKAGQVCLTYEQEKCSDTTPFVANRILGIDQNPNSVGITIVDFKDGKSKIIHAEQITWSNKSRANDAKRDHETTQIAHAIIRLARHYRVSEIALEKLTMGARDAGLGRRFNRLVNNQWNRCQFDWCLTRLCDQYGIELCHVNCAYSSTVGNLTHRNLPDACAAAAEIARRAHYKYQKQLCMFPPLNVNTIIPVNQWKNEGIDLSHCGSWVDIHNSIKNAKLKYRVQLSSLRSAVLRFLSTSSGLLRYTQFACLR
jgi:IS605 OrfB family transposase